MTEDSDGYLEMLQQADPELDVAHGRKKTTTWIGGRGSGSKADPCLIWHLRKWARKILGEGRDD